MKTYELIDGTLVGTQAEAKASGYEYETVEVPTDKPGLLQFLNNRKVDVNPEPETESKPTVDDRFTDEEKQYAQFRRDAIDGNVMLEEFLWKAPLELTLRLNLIIQERMLDHFKDQKEANYDNQS